MRHFDHFLFYAGTIGNDLVTLDQTESHHALKVLRLKSGELFNVTDGNGCIFTCKYNKEVKNTIQGIIIEKKAVPRHPFRITLYIGLPERDPFENIIVDCAALGVLKIVPVINKFSQKAWWDNSWEKQLERFKNKMISAMKQSLYPYLPDLSAPVHFDTALTDVSGSSIVADAEGTWLHTLDTFDNNDISCFIGPPGGFSDEELGKMRVQGFHFVKISPTRLRTELAAVVLCAQIFDLNLNPSYL
ncbi:MAG: 16S rRNA (uracil(1498)-N(3))-methyltransferase [Fibrobacter sp.]|nr:16S rRNA (uracil(1498)-N(3))-methyltransferase [Fibrobacter sp.]